MNSEFAEEKILDRLMTLKSSRKELEECIRQLHSICDKVEFPSSKIMGSLGCILNHIDDKLNDLRVILAINRGE